MISFLYFGPMKPLHYGSDANVSSLKIEYYFMTLLKYGINYS